jgi:hypothetical protein
MCLSNLIMSYFNSVQLPCIDGISVSVPDIVVPQSYFTSSGLSIIQTVTSIFMVTFRPFCISSYFCILLIKVPPYYLSKQTYMTCLLGIRFGWWLVAQHFCLLSYCALNICTSFKCFVHCVVQKIIVHFTFWKSLESIEVPPLCISISVCAGDIALCII